MPTVLIVDDNESITQALQAVVTMAGCDSLVAANGEECLRMIERHACALVLLDNHMPILSGLGVLRRLHDVPPVEHAPPIIMFSAADDGRDEALRLGAVAFVPKTQMLDLVPLIQTYAHCSP